MTKTAKADEVIEVPAELPAGVTVELAKRTVAILDDGGVLIGSRLATDGIDFGDLPTNGTYKYMNGQFVPLGHGFGKIKVAAPHSTEYIMSQIIDTLGKSLPFEARQWNDWYKANASKRDEELSVRRTRAAGK